MNICFFIGEICSEIEFDFILNSKDNSIAVFNLGLLNGSIVKVKAYNEMADYCYSNLQEGIIVQIEGRVNKNIQIILDNIEIIKY